MRLERTCEVTGLHLISDAGVYGFHVGKGDYPALSGAPRHAADSSRTSWNRYDVPGQTYYVAETRECAYAEVLAFFKRPNGSSDPLSEDAAFHDMTLEAYIEEIAMEWSERDFMGLGAVPAGWRFDRGMIPVVIPDAWLIDIEHPDSIAAIETSMGEELGRLGVEHLTTGTLRGEAREITTAIADHLHGMTLDTGLPSQGIHFGSKHGASWCKAFWLDHPATPDILTLSPEPIHVTDEALRAAADRFRIRVF